MVYGGVKNDTIQLNEESLWSGVRLDDVNEQAGKNLGKIRKLIFENKNDEATSLADTTFLGIPRKVRFYEPLANLILTSLNRDEAIRAYRRELDISTGISKVEYNSDGVNYKKEVFISALDNVIIVRISADTPNSIIYSIQLNRQQEAHTFAVDNRTLRLKGQVIDDENPVYGPGGEHMKFEALLNASSSDGVFTENEDHQEVRDASDVTIILTAATDYNIEKLNFDRSINPHLICEGLINKAHLQDYQTIKRRHVADHQSYFNRVTIDLGSNANSALPTDVRLKKLKEGAEDPALLALYFQYGRYLLMGSSRAPGVLPANLQGIWNNLYLPPWGSDYHTNINLQMNYWPAMVTNLSETMHPLTNL
jgi:alpha-L-fucosidase 2